MTTEDIGQSNIGPDFLPEGGTGSMSGRDVTALVGLFSNMLSETERRIIEKLNDNSAGASDRWAQHEREHVALVARFDAHISESVERWAREDREDIVFDARVEPVKALVQWFGLHWKDILIFLLGLLAAFGISQDSFLRFG